MKHSLFFASFAMVVLLGAGCSNTPAQNTNNGNGNENENPNPQPTYTYKKLDCPDGTKHFEGSRHDIEFCYPEKSGEQKVTVKEESDGVVLLVNDAPQRKIWVTEADPKKSRNDIVLGYAIPNPRYASCSAFRTDDANDRESYIIIGSINGEQSLEAVTACTYSGTNDGQFGENAKRSGTFYFYDRKPEVMYILTGEQDASLGQLTSAFLASIQPKE